MERDRDTEKEGEVYQCIRIVGLISDKTCTVHKRMIIILCSNQKRET